jgi:short-subunit dehydrogenase involved in D-alanine esterification of teichoic acids
MCLGDKAALITGGTSGIGSAAARLFANCICPGDTETPMDRSRWTAGVAD